MGIDENVESLSQGRCSPNMVGMSMCNQNAPDATPLIPFPDDSLEIPGIVGRGINHNCTISAAAQHNGIGAWPGHDRRIRGKDDGIWMLHSTPLFIAGG